MTYNYPQFFMTNSLDDLLDALGVPVVGGRLLEDDPPLSVDREKLRLFFDQELGRNEQNHIAMLIANYRQWYDAGLDVLTKRLDQ